MTKKFDLIVIGTGAAGQGIAYKCQSAGWKVAIVDSHPFGGTCGLRGCDPKKVLVGAAEAVDQVNRLNGHGVTGKSQIDWSDLMAFRSTFTDSIPEGSEKGLNNAGITTFHGRARFIDRNLLQVGDETLEAEKFAIASGAKPRELGIEGEAYLTSSAEFLYLEELPERIVFVGGGYISFEFAHIAARAGRQVTILERHDQPLRNFDADMVDMLVEASREVGIDVQLQTSVKCIEKTADGFTVQTSSGNNDATYSADMVVHGAGRVPAIDDLELEKAGIAHNEKGVLVNEYLQSISNPDVYAAGDAAASDGLPLTPVASVEGRVAASNLTKGNHSKPDYTATPSVVFTIPSLAKVGLTEIEAQEKGLKYIVKHQDTSNWYSSRRVNAGQSGFKVLIEEETGQILGAHLLGLQAAEMINMFVLAMRHKLSASDIKRTTFVHPADSSDIAYML